jgi:hypothetical protein
MTGWWGVRWLRQTWYFGLWLKTIDEHLVASCVGLWRLGYRHWLVAAGIHGIMTAIHDCGAMTAIQDCRIMTAVYDCSVMTTIHDCGIVTAVHKCRVMAAVHDCGAMTAIHNCCGAMTAVYDCRVIGAIDVLTIGSDWYGGASHDWLLTASRYKVLTSPDTVLTVGHDRGLSWVLSCCYDWMLTW